jgi:hypothetical protein
MEQLDQPVMCREIVIETSVACRKLWTETSMIAFGLMRGVTPVRRMRKLCLLKICNWQRKGRALAQLERP